MNRVTEPLLDPANPPASDVGFSLHADAVVRAMEKATEVRRRYQFFVWSQSYLQPLVPHQLAVCGAYQRTRRDIAFEAFNCIPVPSALLSTVTDGGSALMQQLMATWIERRGRSIQVAISAGRSLVLDLHALTGVAAGTERDRLVDAGFDELLVHGVSRPQRPTELESLFIFGSVKRKCADQHQMYLELLLPHMHSTWLRVLATERDMSGTQAVTVAPRSDKSRSIITDRESQILFWVREGKSNQQIGDQLCISVLTVKNHVQKILRKLGAANRAQAVAKAMTLNLLDRGMTGGADNVAGA
jgi:transcriptional regulator EpsA